MSLFGGDTNSASGPQQYTGTSSGYGLTLQGENKNVNTGTQTTIKESTALKDIGNVVLKAQKGSTIYYQPAGDANQNSVLDTISGLFSKITGSSSGGGGGSGITVNNTPPVSTVQAIGTSSSVKWLIIGGLAVAAFVVWKLFLSKK